MRRINKKLVEALDKFIAKYSGERLTYKIDHMGCPLCDLFYLSPSSNHFKDRCKECPNYYFGLLGCCTRGELYLSLEFYDLKNYPTLKQFWIDYKSLYLQRIYTNSEIMEILIKPFKEQE